MPARLGQRDWIDARPARIVEVARAGLWQIVPRTRVRSGGLIVGARIVERDLHQTRIAVAPLALHQRNAFARGQIDHRLRLPWENILASRRHRAPNSQAQQRRRDKSRRGVHFSAPTVSCKALMPAMASSSSCCALAAPLMPTAPTTFPSITIGRPP